MTFPHSDEWKTPPSNMTLSPEEIHVWRARLDGIDGNDARLWDVLSGEERHRASRFYFDQHRFRFVRSHGIMREILARYMQRPAHDLKFTADSLGKPYFNDPTESEYHFNLSHSGDLMVIGVTLVREIGIDVEIFSPHLDWKQIARPYFHPNELAFLNGLSGEEECLRHFYRIWVMKEAYLKARGKGISGGLDQVEVENEHWEVPAFNRLPEGEDEKNRWQVFSFKPATGACGTVVVENRPGLAARINLWNWSKPGMPRD